MADYGGRGFVMTLPYLIGLFIGAGIGALFDLSGGFAIFIVFTITIIVGQIFKAVFKW